MRTESLTRTSRRCFRRPTEIRLAIKHARKLLGLSQAEVARRIGRDWSTLGNFEAGRYGLAEGTEKKLLGLLLAGLAERYGTPPPAHGAGLLELRVALLSAVAAAQIAEARSSVAAIPADEEGADE